MGFINKYSKVTKVKICMVSVKLQALKSSFILLKNTGPTGPTGPIFHISS